MRCGDTWNSHFRSEVFCYSENTLLNLPVHRADDDGRLVTIIKHSKMPMEINSWNAASHFSRKRGETSAHGRTPVPASGLSRLPFASARKRTCTHAGARTQHTSKRKETQRGMGLATNASLLTSPWQLQITKARTSGQNSVQVPLTRKGARHKGNCTCVSPKFTEFCRVAVICLLPGTPLSSLASQQLVLFLADAAFVGGGEGRPSLFSG